MKVTESLLLPSTEIHESLHSLTQHTSASWHRHSVHALNGIFTSYNVDLQFIINNSSIVKIMICIINSLRLIDTYRIYASGNRALTGSYNGLSLLQYQAISWRNAHTLSNGPLGTNLSETWIKTQQFPLEKIQLKILLAKLWPFCLSPNMFLQCQVIFGGFIVHFEIC